MAMDFFRSGTRIAVVQMDDPLAGSEEDLLIEGHLVERDQFGLLLDTPDDELGRVFIPWTNIANVVAVEEEADVDQDGVGL